jgi:hypothetical protein
MIKKKLVSVNTGIHVEILDNGYTLEVHGQTENGDYKTVRMFCADIDALAKELDDAQKLYDN